MKRLKLFFACLLMAVLSIGQVWATDFELSSASSVTQDGITVSFAANGGTAPAWYAAGLRLYAKNTITITCANNITGVTFNWEKQGSKAFASVTANPGDYTHPSVAGQGTWEGEATSITFTLGSSGQLQLNTFSVTVQTGGTPTCTAPTFDPEDGEKFEESIDVEISAEDGTTIYYTTDGNAPTTSSSVYSSALHFTSTTTVKAMAAKEGSNNSPVATATYTKMAVVHGYAIDFESELDAYVDWEFSNIGIRNTITAHGGDYYASNVNGSGNGVGSASITTKEKVTTPGVLTFYASKESGNNKTSAWTVSVSDDGSTWEDVESFTDWLADNAGGTWHEELVDLGEHTNVYVRIAYSGSTAIRAIDDINIEMASAVNKPTISVTEEYFLTSTTVTLGCTTGGATIYYTTDGTDPKTSGTKQTYSDAFTINADGATTIRAIANKGSDWSAEATSQTVNKLTAITPAAALEIIAALDNKTATTRNYLVAGTICESPAPSVTAGGTATYYISADGSTTSQLQVYKGLYTNNANFSTTDQIQAGDDVTIVGKLKKYNTNYELDENNAIVTHKPKARLAWSTSEYEADIDNPSSNELPTLTNTNSVAVTYSSTNTDAATISNEEGHEGEITLVGIGTTVIKATFAGNESYKANEVSYTLNVASSVTKADISFEENGGSTVTDLTNQAALPNPLPTTTKAGKNFGGWWTTETFEEGTEAVAGAAVTSSDAITLYAKWLEPYTVAEALAIIDAMENDNDQTANSVYVSGIVCTAPTANPSSGKLTFYISADGTETGRLQAYNCKGLDNASFTAKSDIQVLDIVTIYGPLKKYVKTGTTDVVPEFNTGYLYSFKRLEDAGLTWSEDEFDAYMGQANTFPILTNEHSVAVTYSSTNTAAATISNEAGHEGEIALVAEGTTTIKATFAGDATYKASEVSYTLNVHPVVVHGSITYVENGANEDIDDVADATNLPNPLPTVTKDDYVFGGWWTTETFEEGTEAVAGAALTGDITLYAKWNEIPVWVRTYDSNVAVGAEQYTIKILKSGSTTEYDEFEGQRYGTGSTAGVATINIPANTQTLHFHAAAWNNENVQLTVTMSNGTITLFEMTETNYLVKEADIQGNGTTYIISTPIDEYYSIDLSQQTIDQDEEITFTATSGKRFVLFGVNQEGGVLPVLDHIVVTGDASNKTYDAGDRFDKHEYAGLGAKAIYTLADVEQEPVAIPFADIEWSSDPEVVSALTTSVTVTASYGGKQASKEITGLMVNVPDPEIEVSASSLAFGKVAKGASVTDKTLDITLKSVENATLAISGAGASAFSLDEYALTATGTVTVSASSANVGTFEATLTISDDANQAEAQEVALSITVEATDDLSGTWNLVTDEADLMPGMQVIIASIAEGNSVTTMGKQAGANEDGNNRVGVTGSSVSGTVLTPVAGTKVFTLVDAGNGKLAFQGMNGKYLYAASSSANHLKEQATNNANGEWSISIEDNIATITAPGSSNRNLMRFNPNNGNPIFACYATNSTTGTLVTIYAKAFDYEREIPQGQLSTTCLPNGGVIYGASIFEVAYMDYEADGTTPHKIYFDEVEGGIMEAGVPYIVLANEGSEKFGVYYSDNENKAAQSKNGLVGYIGDGKYLAEDDYFIYNNMFYHVSAADANTRVHISNNRAYINLSGVPGYNNEPISVPAPGRRRVSLGNGAPKVATGIDALNASDKPVKMIINGQLFILRGEKMYDVKGQLVK